MNRTFILVGRIFAYLMSIVYFITIIFIPLGVLNIVAARKLNEALEGKISQDEAQNWAIYLIFTTIVGGIFALLGVNDVVVSVPTPKFKNESKLRELNRLYEEGLIIKEEYDERRAKIVEKL